MFDFEKIISYIPTNKYMLKIKPHSKRDIPLRVKWLNNPLVSVFVSDEPTKKTTLKKETTWFNAYKKNKHKIFFTIYSDKTPIGFMGLSNISATNKNADLFIAIGEDDYRGKGFGKSGLEWLIDYAFQKLKLNKVNLGVIDDNIPAIKLYEKVGFRIEGEMKEEVFINGKWHSMLSMAVFKKDWEIKNV